MGFPITPPPMGNTTWDETQTLEISKSHNGIVLMPYSYVKDSLVFECYVINYVLIMCVIREYKHYNLRA